VSVAAPARIVAGFVRALRAGGLSVPTGAAVTFAEALGLLGLEDPGRVYWAGRATLVRRPEDIERYDRTFSAYWAGVAAPTSESPREREVTLALDADEEGGGEEVAEQAEGDVQAVRYSPAEVLSRRDLATLGPDEWAEAQRLVSALRVTTELRSSRRTRPSRRRAGDHPDLRRTFRRNVRHRGVPVERAWREPAERPRRMVFLLDVSGSMEPYSRALVRFAHAAVASRRAGEVEVFALGTRLTRITKELSRRNPEAALHTAAGAVSDWSGGTRLGETIGRFNDLWGVRGMARGAVVVVCSDGWDRGDPEVMAAEMARLARVARRVVWVNPLKASPGYAPLARGMAAALPYVEQFVEGHSVSSLEQLAAVLAGARRRVEVHG
jgi:uncharacterized protein with von Willebrand factor type A (vWA) domain